MGNKIKLPNGYSEQDIPRAESERMAQAINRDVYTLVGLLKSIDNNKREGGKPSYFKLTDKHKISVDIQLTNDEYKDMIRSKLSTLKERILNNANTLIESLEQLDIYEDDKK